MHLYFQGCQTGPAQFGGAAGNFRQYGISFTPRACLLTQFIKLVKFIQFTHEIKSLAWHLIKKRILQLVVELVSSLYLIIDTQVACCAFIYFVFLDDQLVLRSVSHYLDN